jgi:HlyD family secretion protein
LKKFLALALLLAAGAIVWAVLRTNDAPKANFARAHRQQLISTLPTNGKVEPFEWRAVRAEAAGIATRVDVHEGQTVGAAAVLATMSDPQLQADIEAAEAKLSEARASLAPLESGGRPAELTDIENNLSRVRFELQQATGEYNSLRRLAEKQAATTVEVQSARAKIRQSEMQIEALEKRKTALVGATDVQAAKARVQDVQVALDLARKRAALSVVRTPIGGIIYGLAIRPGAYLNVGDLVANVGTLDRLRVRVYVDEPELGRVAEGQPVSITWQALPGKKWEGTVEHKPTSIQALGSRQVGEVICTIENPGRELTPGANVDAEIRTAVVDNALVIPRETLRHDAGGDYVLALKDNTVERRIVKPGVSSVAMVQILDGLSERDAVAVPSDTTLKPGDRVTATVTQ